MVIPQKNLFCVMFFCKISTWYLTRKFISMKRKKNTLYSKMVRMSVNFLGIIRILTFCDSVISTFLNMGGQFGLILSFFFCSSFRGLLSATTVGGLAVMLEAVSFTGVTSFCWVLSLSPSPDVPSSCSSSSAGGVGGLSETSKKLFSGNQEYLQTNYSLGFVF